MALGVFQTPKSFLSKIIFGGRRGEDMSVRLSQRLSSDLGREDLRPDTSDKHEIAQCILDVLNKNRISSLPFH